jgi:hypothetical protein
MTRLEVWFSVGLPIMLAVTVNFPIHLRLLPTFRLLLGALSLCRKASWTAQGRSYPSQHLTSDAVEGFLFVTGLPSVLVGLAALVTGAHSPMTARGGGLLVWFGRVCHP